jgi:type II secretory pathway pseudopilin PulG
MNIVIVILALTAVLVFPNMIAIRRSRALKDVEAAIWRLPREARHEALRSQQPVAIRVEGSTLVMERTSIQGDSVVVKRVNLREGITVTGARTGRESTDLDSWRWMAYPDGSADQGGLEFMEGNSPKSLYLPKQGDEVWGDGNLPDTSQEEWQAGEVQYRANASTN